MDIYRDYFTRENLLASLAEAPYIPGRLGELGLFSTRGLTSTTLALEEMPRNAPSLLTAIPRGSPLPVTSLEDRKVHTFQTSTYGLRGAVYADEVLSMRVAGTGGGAEVIQTRVTETVTKLRRSIDLLHEDLRMATVLSPNNAFGNAPASVQVDAGSTSLEIRKELFQHVVLPIETALVGLTYSGIRVLCSDTYWAELIENDNMRATYLNTMAASSLRGDPLESFSSYGMTFERYRGTGSTAITAGSAVCIPMGVPDLFIQAFAPDDTVDSVGSGAMGSPYYLKSYPLEDEKGWGVRIQSHVVMVCTRPDAIVKIALT